MKRLLLSLAAFGMVVESTSSLAWANRGTRFHGQTQRHHDSYNHSGQLNSGFNRSYSGYYGHSSYGSGGHPAYGSGYSNPGYGGSGYQTGAHGHNTPSYGRPLHNDHSWGFGW